MIPRENVSKTPTARRAASGLTHRRGCDLLSPTIANSVIARIGAKSFDSPMNGWLKRAYAAAIRSRSIGASVAANKSNPGTLKYSKSAPVNITTANHPNSPAMNCAGASSSRFTITTYKPSAYTYRVTAFVAN